MLKSACVFLLAISASADTWYRLGNLTKNVADEFLNGCIIIMVPRNVSAEDGRGLRFLAANLARADSKRLASQLQVGFYYYSTILKHANDRMDVRSCYNSLHVVKVDNNTEEELVPLSKNYPIKHSMWLIYSDSTWSNTATRVLEMMKFSLDGKVLTATEVSEDTIRLDEVYRVAEGYPVRVKNIGFWYQSKDQLSVQSGRRSYRILGNFEQFQFRAGAIENWPISSFTTGLAGKSMVLDGMFPRVWSELSDILNFTTTFLECKDGASGKLLSSGSWNGLIGMLYRNEVDVTLSEIGMTMERLSATEALLPLLKARLEIYYRPEGIPWDWLAIFRPFSSGVWAILALWIILAAIFMRLTSRLAYSHGLTASNLVEENSPGYNIFLVLQSVCQQGASHTPKVCASRIIFVMCYLVSAVLIPCYSASLISSLAQKESRLPFDSVKDLVEAKYPIYLGDNMFEYDFFAKSEDPWIQRAYKELVHPVQSFSDDQSYIIAYKKLCTEPVAMFGADTTVEERLASSIPNCVPFKFSKPIMEIHLVMSLRKGLQFREILNCNIMRMIEFGLMNRWKAKFDLTGIQNDAEPSVSYVDMDDVVEVFIFLLVAAVLSVGILIVEIVYYRSELRKTHQYKLKI